MLDLASAQKGLTLLRDCGMQKINFTGGEPFLHASTMLGPLVDYCKFKLELECVSVVSNGSLITKEWIRDHTSAVDIIAISCDSFKKDTNRIIGRGDGNIVDIVARVSNWCAKYNILFKINTVVNSFNWKENMNDGIKHANPFRWKCFQLLILKGENSAHHYSFRNASKYTITEHQFQVFLDTHYSQSGLIPENNKLMVSSYFLLDEQMRFLNCTQGVKMPTKSILEVGVENALKDSGFDQDSFYKRGGIYNWTRDARGY